MAEVKFLDLHWLFDLDRTEYLKAAESVLTRGAFIGGDELGRFEKEFAGWIGEGYHAVGCANGTDAIYLAARTLNLPAGSEVIVPANTYVATVEALTMAGFKIKLVDVDPETCLMQPDAIRRAITPSTRLLAPVHLYGQMCAMDEIALIAKEKSCSVLEDASQSHGATWKSKPVGYFSDVATYSFYPGKNLGAFGDAGAIASRNEKLITACRAVGNHGGIAKYEHIVKGINSRLDNLQAAFLLIKMKRIDQWNEARRRVASWYQEGLSGIPGLQLVKEHPEARGVYHLYVVRVEKRDELQKHLSANGIATGIHYPKAIHELPAFAKDFAGQAFPNAEYLARHGLSLPMCPSLNEEKVNHVVSTVRKFFGK